MVHYGSFALLQIVKVHGSADYCKGEKKPVTQ